MTTVFKDTDGREYDLKVSLAAAITLEEKHGINLRDHYSGTLYEQITASTSTLLNVVGVLAAKSLAEHGLTVQQMADSLDGDAVAAMQAALEAAIVDFSPPVARPAMRTIQEKRDRVASLTGLKRISLVEEMLSETEVARMLDEEGDRARRDFNAKRQASRDADMNSSPSPESALPTGLPAA